jgi:hypothetical protein
MLEVATVVEGLILFHRGVKVTERFVPPWFNTLCNRGDVERGTATLRLETLRGRMH